jgi:hypothetical protein
VPGTTIARLGKGTGGAATYFLAQARTNREGDDHARERVYESTYQAAFVRNDDLPEMKSLARFSKHL